MSEQRAQGNNRGDDRRKGERRAPTPVPRVARIRRVEDQTCPRRGEGGVSARFPLPDYWETGRWATTQEEHDAEVAADQAEAKKKGYTLISSEYWWRLGVPPRTCSFCGGAHPDDVNALLREGWLVDPTDKHYKRYLAEPDGTQPVPPVKVYTMHFTAEQVTEFNAILTARAHPRPTGG